MPPAGGSEGGTGGGGMPRWCIYPLRRGAEARRCWGLAGFICLQSSSQDRCDGRWASCQLTFSPLPRSKKARRERRLLGFRAKRIGRQRCSASNSHRGLAPWNGPRDDGSVAGQLLERAGAADKRQARQRTDQGDMRRSRRQAGLARQPRGALSMRKGILVSSQCPWGARGGRLRPKRLARARVDLAPILTRICPRQRGRYQVRTERIKS
jgi:hypothetical protein